MVTADRRGATAAAGAATVGTEIVSEGHLKVDRAAGGPLAAAILKPEYGMQMKSLVMVTADTETGHPAQSAELRATFAVEPPSGATQPI